MPCEHCKSYAKNNFCAECGEKIVPFDLTSALKAKIKDKNVFICLVKEKDMTGDRTAAIAEPPHEGVLVRPLHRVHIPNLSISCTQPAGDFHSSAYETYTDINHKLKSKGGRIRQDLNGKRISVDKDRRSDKDVVERVQRPVR
jgi:hypothetical protein